MRCFMDQPENWLGRHATLAVMANGFPIRALHLLLAPAEHRTGLTEDDLRSAHDFAVRFPDYLVFHNQEGSGASQPHVHFQALPRDSPLPIEMAPRSELIRTADVIVARVEEYPAYVLVVTGPGVLSTTDTILVALRRTPINLLCTRLEVFIVPRRAERPPNFDTNFGALEMGGCIVLVDEYRYRTLTHEAVRHAIAACGWCRPQASFEATIKARLREAGRERSWAHGACQALPAAGADRPA